MASNNQNQYKHCFKKILITHTHKKIEEKVKKEAFLENPLTHKKYFFLLCMFPSRNGNKEGPKSVPQTLDPLLHLSLTNLYQQPKQQHRLFG